VDLTLSEEQQELVGAARRMLAERWPTSRVRAAEASGDGHDPEGWAQMGALGWPGLVLPEEVGGSGRGMVELALVCEQLGRAAVSCPLLYSVTLVALPLLWAAPEALRRRWLAALADGSAVGTLAHLEPGAGGDEWAPPGLALAESGSGRWRLAGSKHLVAFASVADVLLVSARLGEKGTVLVAVERGPGTASTRQRTLGGDPLYRVDFDVEVGEEDLVVGDPRHPQAAAAPRGAGSPDASGVLRLALDHAAVAATAYAAGLAARVLEMSVAHACDRRQFGRPIGAFQAVAHRCAEMRAAVDAVRLLALQGAWALDQGAEAELEPAAAKAYAGQAVREVFVHAHQVHGAVGFSMEHDLQLFTRRAKAFELSFGPAARHLERVAKAMGL
jgi:alkylation response protein AidB-like acyl-CoA dehydrogenase